MLQTVSLYAVLVIALIFDFKKCRIPNWLVVAGYMMGGLSAYLGDSQWYFYIFDSFLLLLILYPLFLVGALGGGDIKLLTCISVYLGFEQGLNLSILAIAIGAVISILKIAFLLYQKKEFQFSHLYIHFSLPIALATLFINFHGGFIVWQIF